MSRESSYNITEGSSALDLYYDSQEDIRGILIYGDEDMFHPSPRHSTDCPFTQQRTKQIISAITLIDCPLKNIRYEMISGKPFNRMTKTQSFCTGLFFIAVAFATVYFGV